MNSVWGVIGRYAGIVTAGVFVITVGWAQAANVTPTDASMVLNGDTLVVGQAGAGGAVTSTCASASTDSTLTYTLGSKVKIDKGANTSVTLLVGNASPSATPILVRSNRAVLVISQVNASWSSKFEAIAWDMNEQFKVTGSGANLPTIVNGMVSASIVAKADSDSDWASMCFLTYDAANGFIPVTTEQIGFTGSDNTKIVGYGGGTLTSNTACYALRFKGNITISNGVTLTVGNGTGQAGLLSDAYSGKDITGGGTLDFGAAELVYHTKYRPSGNNDHTLSCQVTGSGGITVALPTNTWLYLNNPSNTFSGGLTILGGAVLGDYGSNPLDYSHSLGAGVISIANGAGLAPGNRAVLTNNVYLLGGDPNLAAKFANNTILSNTISGPGNLGCNDPGGGGNLCEIYGSNTFTGGTIIYKCSAGNSTARLYHNSALGAGTGPVVFSNGTATVTLSVNKYNPKIGTLCGPTNNIVDLGDSSSTRLTIGNDNGTGEFAGSIQGQGTLVKIGAGTQILSGSNTFNSGSGTIVSNGTLVINGSVPNAVTVVSGGTLGGTGVVTGVVTNFGTITAADKGTVGTLTVTNLVMKENSTYYWDYNATTNDTINVTGNLTLPNVATVNVNQVSSGRMPNPAVLFNFGAGLGAAANNTNLLNWVITGARSDTRAVVRGKQVQLLSTTGMVLEIY